MDFTAATWIIAGFVLLGLAILLILLVSLARERAKNRMLEEQRAARTAAHQARARTAVEGELQAVDFLEQAGYEVLAQQHPEEARLAINGEVTSFPLKIDFIVEKDGLKYVADVKTGAKATSPRHGPTRRQLLEYKLVFQAAGALLVDMTCREIHHLDFLNYGAATSAVAPDQLAARTLEPEPAVLSVPAELTPQPAARQQSRRPVLIGVAVGFVAGIVVGVVSTD